MGGPPLPIHVSISSELILSQEATSGFPSALTHRPLLLLLLTLLELATGLRSAVVKAPVPGEIQFGTLALNGVLLNVGDL